MRLVQFKRTNGERAVGVASEDGTMLHLVNDAERVYDLALEAIRDQRRLTDLVSKRLSHEIEDYEAAFDSGRILAPIDHPDPAHTVVSLTGLTHIGSAKSRDEMHAKLSQDSNLTDSMRMFKLGLERGRHTPIGVQPEWAYKGDGSCVVDPSQRLERPSYALDGGEEAEIAGLYIVGEDGLPYRVGFALGNEFADHTMERQNYLYLAHSKLRECSFGPELLLGALPDHISGTVRIVRDEITVWQEAFETGEANMVHSIANLEHHHFKYSGFRQPGQLHIHFFGASALSTASGFETLSGDIFEIESPAFGRALRNPMHCSSTPEQPMTVRSL